jgi:glycosyltransferase involved in cell wall biosynthesis
VPADHRTPAERNDGADRPVMSVAVPCYNYGNYLPQCIDSIRSQEGVDVRILIIDDASPDGSGAICQQLADDLPEVECLIHPTNQGHLTTFSDGAAWANGLGFTLLSADDMLAPGALLRSAGVLLANPEVGLVFGDVQTFADVPPPPITGDHTTTVYAGHDWMRRRCETAQNNVFSPEVVLRSTVQQRIGGYHPTLQHTSDFHMWLRAASLSDVAHIGGVTHAFYRQHGSNMSSAHFGIASRDLEQRRRALGVFFSEDWLSPELRRSLQSAAMRALARDAAEQASRILDERGANADSDALIDFAVETDPSITRRPAGLGFALRRRVGPGKLTWLPPFIAGRGIRWLRYRRRTPGWHRGPD